MKKVAIVQSSYIPWKGYFDIIGSVDSFVLLDDVQYTRRDWRNRNQIKTPHGPKWITIPVKVKGKYHQTIRETCVVDDKWQLQHWNLFSQNYRRAEFFKEIMELLEPVYCSRIFEYISDINRELIIIICNYLGIKTKIIDSSGYEILEDKTAYLLSLCQKLGATEYVSGPLAKDYIDAQIFADCDIKLNWFDYTGYPSYPQLWGEFSHHVSILDLLFNCGQEAVQYMKFAKEG